MSISTFFQSWRRGASLLTSLVVGTAMACAFTVVLDPGHGGKDYGAIGSYSNEKTINLSVARLVRDMLNQSCPDAAVLMTRSDDRFISLRERADFANRNGGDIFVSIHTNSIARENPKRRTIQGAAVYTLGLHKSDANLEVAQRENAVISLDPEFKANYEGFDPNSSESYIIFEMGQDKHLGQSINLAQQIQNELVRQAGRTDHGVRQAGFWVLWATSMPAVLIELDFICNPNMERYLSSDEGQQQMASAITTAIKGYIDSHAPVVIPEAPVAEEKPAPKEEPKKREPKKPKQQTPELKDVTVTYHVQILASATQLKKKAPEFKGYDAKELREGNWFKYYVGSFDTQEKAEKKLQEIREKFPEAFIIKVRRGKPKK